MNSVLIFLVTVDHQRPGPAGSTWGTCGHEMRNRQIAWDRLVTNHTFNKKIYALNAIYMCSEG